jgi:hypothetical protein
MQYLHISSAGIYMPNNGVNDVASAIKLSLKAKADTISQLMRKFYDANAWNI